MPHSKAEQLSILKRRRDVAAWYLANVPQWEMAQRAGVDPGQISRDLAAIKREWRASMLADFQERIGMELAKINAVERQCWLEWDESKKDAQTRSAKTVRTPAGQDAAGQPLFAERSEASRREEGQCGDPRFLAGIRACVKQRCELLGLIVAKVAPTSPDGREPARVVEFIVYTPDNGREPHSRRKPHQRRPPP